MHQSARKNRRRDVLSLPPAQLRIILVFAVFAMLYAALNIYISTNAFTKLAEAAWNLAQPGVAQRDLQIAVDQHRETLHLQLAVFSFLSFCMLCLAGVLLSHRLGGPVFHLKKYMQETIAGGTQPRAVTFRKKDFFHDLADQFNRFQEHFGILKRGGKPPS